MRPKKKVLSYNEAKELLKKHDIKNRDSYRKFRKMTLENSELLPYDYENFWKEDFISAEDFFGIWKYPYTKLKAVCIENNIKDTKAYRKFRKESKEHGIHMPFEPKNHYIEWGGWLTFFDYA